MAYEDYTRPASGFRFKFDGMKTNSTADSMPEGKYPFAQNVRGYGDSSVQSRTQLTQSQAAPSAPNVTLALEPVLKISKVGTNLVHDGTIIDALYAANKGASIVPFRPSESSSAWDYVFDDNKARKVNIPLTGAEIVQNIGIAEPQAPVEAGLTRRQVILYPNPSTPGGTAGGFVAGVSRVTDVVGAAVFADPAAGNVWSLQVLGTQQYQRQMNVTINGSGFVVLDVFPVLTANIGIQGIYYFAGTTGRCVVVPVTMSQAPGSEGQSITDEDFLGMIRRGSIVKIGAESCLILSTSVGPDGNICFETVTTGTHTTADSITSVPAIQVEGPSIPVAAQAISQLGNTWNVTAGIGTLSGATGLNPFVTGAGVPMQKEDYLNIGLKVDHPENITEVKIIFDVKNGAADYVTDYYYVSIRQNDLQASVANALTQLGAVQLIAQRAIIDSVARAEGIQTVSESGNQAQTASSPQTGTGTNTWVQLLIPIANLTRVGGDDTRSLQNTQGVQILVNCTANVSLATDQFGSTMGGGQVDVGDTGVPYQYWIRPRSSLTGAKGNPSPIMRYGVSPRRALVSVPVPIVHTDTQADTWDVFRQGGTLEQPTKVGDMLIGSAGSFNDNFSDASIFNNEELSYRQLQPFPSVSPPLQISLVTITGSVVVATIPGVGAILSPTQLQQILPGNILHVGLQAYTVWTRPTLLSLGVYLFRINENGGVQNGIAGAYIEEPLVAAQFRSKVWGPDVNGTFFSVGDPFRSGVIARTNPFDPDGCTDVVDEPCAPVEPLVNGCIIDGTSVVFSGKRAWAGYPQGDPARPYRWVEIPVQEGMAGDFCICTDGKTIYYVARDGIRKCALSESVNLTDEDLFNIFPHEGWTTLEASAFQYTYAVANLALPNYAQANRFRIAVVNSYLFFDYVDNNLNYHTLVCDLRKMAWSYDLYSSPVSIHAGVPQNLTVNNLSPVYAGDRNGTIYVEAQSTPGLGEQIICILATREEMMGDLRSRKAFGDVAIDALFAGGNVTCFPIFLGVSSLATIFPGGQLVRPQDPILLDLGGQTIQRSLGLMFVWTDQGTYTTFYIWQPSYIPQPELTDVRFTDWDDAGTMQAKFFQGFEMEADTLGLVKSVLVRDNDVLATHDFNTGDPGQPLNQINLNGQNIDVYSFVTPFVAHQVRLEPQTIGSFWRLWRVRWIFAPYPDIGLQWITEQTTHDLTGYQHVHHAMIAYSATAQVTLTIFVNNIPFVYTLPSTGGVKSKALVTFQPVKGLWFQYSFTCANAMALWKEDCELYVKNWGADGPYVCVRGFGGTSKMEAEI